ncbi:hypothetical protein [[Phormidium] sp. ETS-05]|uniref:hypothetical protein n=1 Tax=[Phormidium] sp. ETS-05 TaxID=222819 RepID=UPI0018EF2444|nr:hypothetical protein [[Phormidium] sp. ETS-05]
MIKITAVCPSIWYKALTPNPTPAVWRGALIVPDGLTKCCSYLSTIQLVAYG